VNEDDPVGRVKRERIAQNERLQGVYQGSCLSSNVTVSSFKAATCNGHGEPKT